MQRINADVVGEEDDPIEREKRIQGYCYRYAILSFFGPGDPERPYEVPDLDHMYGVSDTLFDGWDREDEALCVYPDCPNGRKLKMKRGSPRGFASVLCNAHAKQWQRHKTLAPLMTPEEKQKKATAARLANLRRNHDRVQTEPRQAGDLADQEAPRLPDL